MNIGSIGGGSGCQGGSHPKGSGNDGSGDLEKLLGKLHGGGELNGDEKSQLKNLLMNKGYSSQEADGIINNHGKLPNGQTPEDIQ